jgi:hypothetical protein
VTIASFLALVMSLYGLVGTCLITIFGTATPSGLVLPRIIFWGLASFLDFLCYSDHFPTSNVFFLFYRDFGDPFVVPLLLSKTCYNSSLDLLDVF